MKNKTLEKFVHNEKLLFLIPNLIIGYVTFYYYVSNLNGEVFFYEVILLFLLFFLINSCIYLFIRKALQNPQKVFCIMCFISMFYYVSFNLIGLLIFIAVILFLIYDFKKFVHCKLDYIIGIVSFIVIMLFSFVSIIGVYDALVIAFKSREYDYSLDIDVDKEKESPNIYWVHCDGMISLEMAIKYFNYYDKDLKKYLKGEDFVINEDVSMAVGHSTQRALVSMFNPHYYDNFFQEYLNELEETYVDPKKKMPFLVNYYEYEEKRLNNELFNALKEKGYTTVSIAEFNQYTSLYTDYYYDFYFADKSPDHIIYDGKDELRFMDNRDIIKNNSNKLLSHIRFTHSKTLMSASVIFPLVKDINYLDYETVDYESLDLSNYPKTKNSSYWISKAILKSIDDSSKMIDSPNFTFIDFKLNHLPMTYNSFGERVSDSYKYNLNSYQGNYIYSAKLLIELLKFIKDTDDDAIIIVQADHGIHVLDEQSIMDFFHISREEVLELRNSVFSAYYIPEQYKNGDEEYLDNPLNISRYLINNYVGKNYEYIE